MVHLLLAGPIIAGETLSRFFTLHVFIIPGAIIAIVSMHLRLVLTKGINEYPKPGDPVRRATYDAEYAEIMRKEGVPFVPHAIGKDLIFAALVIVGILGAALIFGPKGPGGPPNPTLVDTNPRPDFYFLSIFAAWRCCRIGWKLSFCSLRRRCLIGFLLALPFISGTGEKSAQRRPVAVLSVIFIMLVIGVLTYMGETSPWSPRMGAWSGNAIPVQYVKDRTPLELTGASFCRTSNAGTATRWAAKAASAALRWMRWRRGLTKDQMVRQVIQGGGNMPAYGKKLSPAETEALVDFMTTLKPKTTPAVRPPDKPLDKLPRDLASLSSPQS